MNYIQLYDYVIYVYVTAQALGTKMTTDINLNKLLNKEKRNHNQQQQQQQIQEL